MPKKPVVMEMRDITTDDWDKWHPMVLDYDPDLTVTQRSYAWARFKGVNPVGDVYGKLILLNGKVAGFMHFHNHLFLFAIRKTWYLSDLYIKPKHRRKGLARFALKWLIAESKRRDCERLYWVTEHANPVRKLYDEFGIPQFVRYHMDFEEPKAYKLDLHPVG